MTTRHTGLKAALMTVLLFAVAGAALFACGGKDTAGPEVTSAPRPTTTTTSAGDLDLQGEGAQAQVDEVLAKVKPKVPADLQDDLKVVGDAYAKAAKAGIVKAPQVLDEPGFRKANKAIGEWLSKECGVDLSGN